MMPQRIIKRRDPSAIATCERLLDPFTDTDGTPKAWRCGAAMQLVVTQNPIGTLPYDELVVTRCLAGHLADSRGVLQEEKA